MLKAILLSAVLAACIGAGRTLSNLRRRRHERIAELLAAMRVLRLRMLNSLEPLGILLRKSDSPLFRDLGNSLWEGDGLEACWGKLRAESLRRGGLIDGLQPPELALLDDFFARLGCSGREEQCALFSQSISSLEELHAQAKQRHQEAARLYTALGALAGIALCILII